MLLRGRKSHNNSKKEGSHSRNPSAAERDEDSYGAFIVLPKELLNEILRFVPPKTLCVLCFVSRAFRALAGQEDLWKRLYIELKPPL
jgi:hypothetical protein